MVARCARFAATIAVAAAAACASPFAPRYEYEEQLYLLVDGSATVTVESSLAALVALRGAAIDPSLNGATDRESLRHLFEASGCRVESVGRLWERHGRRFAQIRIVTDDVSTLTACSLLAWSSYSLQPAGEDAIRYRQQVGASAGANPGPVNWDGSETVAFRLHLPSRVRWHNARTIDGIAGELERGNILTWPQRLRDRLAGKPVDIEVEMESTSILHTTLWLFVGAFLAAVAVLAVIVWMTIRRGRKTPWPHQPRG